MKMRDDATSRVAQRVREVGVTRPKAAAGRSTSPALFVTGANERFRPVVEIQRAHLARLGYRSLCFDLGGLGSGRQLLVADPHFQEHGFYHEREGWKTRALHKPEMVRHALAEVEEGEVLVYLDGDAICYEPVDELARPGFDIGVTVRWRWDRGIEASNARYMGRFNAGVIVFRKSVAAERFVEAWQQKTAELGNDQRALNTLLNPRDRAVKAGESFRAAGVSVHAFDGMRYNNPERYVGVRPKIVHFKSQSWEAHLRDRGHLPGPPTRPFDIIGAFYDGSKWAAYVQYAILRRRIKALLGRSDKRAP